MRTLDHPQPPGVPRSAVRHQASEGIEVLTRTNHDMRSPLSVILGVFELLADTDNLTEGERRYLQLGMKAADELLSLADAMRLYSALERNLVTIDAIAVDLSALALERFEAAVSGKGFEVRCVPGPDDRMRALGDVSYLDLALANLARHLAGRLPEPGDASSIALRQAADATGRVTLRIALENGSHDDDAPAAPEPGTGRPVVEDDLGVLNAVRLVEMMGGTVWFGPAPDQMVITLPAETQSAPS